MKVTVNQPKNHRCYLCKKRYATYKLETKLEYLKDRPVILAVVTVATKSKRHVYLCKSCRFETYKKASKILANPEDAYIVTKWVLVKFKQNVT